MLTNTVVFQKIGGGVGAGWKSEQRERKKERKFKWFVSRLLACSFLSSSPSPTGGYRKYIN